MSAEIERPLKSESRDLIYDPERGVYIDPSTGLVVEEGVVSPLKEWREYGPEDVSQRARTGPPVTSKVHDAGITSYVDTSTLLGRRLGKLNSSMRRPKEYRARKEVEAKSLMNDLAGKLGLPNIIAETAGMIIKEASKKGLLRKNTIRACVGAVIVGVCRVLGTPLDTKALKDVLGVDDKELFRTAKKLAWAGVFNKLKERASEARQGLGSPAAVKMLPKIATSAGLGDDVLLLSHRILETLGTIDPAALSGKNPDGIAAAAIYIASTLLDKKKGQRDLADSLDISEVTIRNRCRDIVDHLDIVIYV